MASIFSIHSCLPIFFLAPQVYAADLADPSSLSPPIQNMNAILTPASGPCGENGFTLSVTREGADSVLHIRPNGSPRFKFEARECKLVTLKKGTKLYHWGHEGWIKKLVQAGKYSELDYARYRETAYQSANARYQPPHPAMPQYADWGFYMSRDIIDSDAYGEKLLISTLDQDLKIIEPKSCSPSQPGHEDLLNLWQEAGGERLRTLGITGIAQQNNSDLWDGPKSGQRWMFFIDERGTSHLREATQSDFLSDEGMGRAPRTYKDWKDLDSRYPIQDSDWVAIHLPKIHKILSGKHLNANDLDPTLEEIRLLADYCDQPSEHAQSTIMKKLTQGDDCKQILSTLQGRTRSLR